MLPKKRVVIKKAENSQKGDDHQDIPENSVEEPEKIDGHTKGYHSICNKPLKVFLENTMNAELKKQNIVTVGVTCVIHNPDEISCDEAWATIHERIARIEIELEKRPEVVFFLVATEVHEKNKKPKVLGKKDKAPTFNRKIKVRGNNGEATTAFVKNDKGYLYKEAADEIRANRIQRDVYEKTIDPEMKLTDLEYTHKLWTWDFEHDLIDTGKSPANEDYRIMVHADTRFPIIMKDYRWYIEKDQQDEEEIDPEALAFREKLLQEKKGTPGEEKDEEGKNKLTLIGYPHLHTIIGLTSYNGGTLTGNEIFDIFNTEFADIQIGIKKSDSKHRNVECWDPADKLFGYNLKNVRHTVVLDRLKDPTDICVLNLYRTSFALSEYLGKMTRVRNCNVKIVDKIKGRVLPQVKVTNRVVGAAEIPTQSVPITDSKTREQEAFLAVAEKMKRNHLAVFWNAGQAKCSDIFTIQEGSKMTWIQYDTITNFIGSLLDIKTFDTVRKYKNSIVDILQTPGQNIFPHIELDGNWIEYKDFFLFTPLGIRSKFNDKYPCYRYYDDMSLADMDDIKKYTPELWIAMLEITVKDPVKRKSLLRHFFETYLPPTHKNPNLFMYGPPNCGKTTALDGVIRTFAPHMVLYMSSTKSTFALAGLLKGARVLILDEGIGIGTINPGVFLKVLEGDSNVAIDQKYQDQVTANVSFSKIIFASNTDTFGLLLNPEDPVDFSVSKHLLDKNLTAAYKKRIDIIEMTELQNCKVGMKAKILEESSKIPLYLSHLYFGDTVVDPNPDEYNDLIRLWYKQEDFKNPKKRQLI